jgi:hypothetical protein
MLTKPIQQSSSAHIFKEDTSMCGYPAKARRDLEEDHSLRQSYLQEEPKPSGTLLLDAERMLQTTRNQIRKTSINLSSAHPHSMLHNTLESFRMTSDGFTDTDGHRQNDLCCRIIIYHARNIFKRYDVRHDRYRTSK